MAPVVVPASPLWITCDIPHSLHKCPQIQIMLADRVVCRMLCGKRIQVGVRCRGCVVATSKIKIHVFVYAVGGFEDTA